jgi:GR25 family glycosyltransferase involved in LPS biosynthesis
MKNFVINLGRQPERYDYFLKLNALTKITFERFEASDGASLSREEAVGMKLVAPGAQLTPGAVGCAASHFRIWQQTVEAGTPALVFEDDAVLRNDIKARLDFLLSGLTDWDYIALGYNTDVVLDLDWAPGMRAMMTFQPKYPNDEYAAVFQVSTAQVAAIRLNNCFGTPGYVVSPAGARKLLQLCFPLDNRSYSLPALNATGRVIGIDAMLNAIFASIRAFACFAPLVVTKNEQASSSVQTGAAQTW